MLSLNSKTLQRFMSHHPQIDRYLAYKRGDIVPIDSYDNVDICSLSENSLRLIDGFNGGVDTVVSVDLFDNDMLNLAYIDGCIGVCRLVCCC